jgi:hypothetical protein
MTPNLSVPDEIITENEYVLPNMLLIFTRWLCVEAKYYAACIKVYCFKVVRNVVTLLLGNNARDAKK